MTLLDILDSAVKISLGAIIGGLFAYHQSKLMISNEKLKIKNSRISQLLAELTEKTTLARTKFIATAFPFYTAVLKGESLNYARDAMVSVSELSDAIKLIAQAKSNSTILGSNDMTLALSEIYDRFYLLYRYMVTIKHDALKIEVNLLDLENEVNASFDDVFRIISEINSSLDS